MNAITEARSARARRRAARRSRAQHLVTADEHSLLELEAFLATLPLCATGRVFIEVPDAAAISHIDAPARMTVTWLPRSRRTGAPGSGRACTRGMALTRATCAWADEMLCDDSGTQTRVTLMGGYLSTADIIEHLGANPASESVQIHAPERFHGLLPGTR